MPDPLLRVERVTKSLGGAIVVRDVSLTLDGGKVLGLVGRSGSGKSTLARCIARIEKPDNGDIRIDGRLDYGPSDVQLIFQEAAATLNPRFTAAEILEEPLVLQKRGTPGERRGKVRQWLEIVGIPKAAADKGALEFSGGERQRLAIGRAMILEPKLLILDESLSGLDLLLQAQLTALLRDLRRRLGLTCILISHDLGLAASIADDLAVMSHGEVVERASAAELMGHPRHPASRELVSASAALTLHARGDMAALVAAVSDEPPSDNPEQLRGAGWKHVSKRILHGLALLIAVSFAAFAFAQLAPGDYFTALNVDPRISPGTADAMRRHVGLHRPFLVRYGAWAAGVARGDFGVSLAYNAPVSALLRERILATLLLTGTATLASWIFALPLGIWSATQRSGWADMLTRVFFTLLLIIPDLLLAIAVLVLAVQTGWFPPGGMGSPDRTSMTVAQGLRDLLHHLALPAGVLAIGMLPVLARHVRASMIATLDAPFALAARAHGIPSRRRLFRHLLPVAANPLIGLFGLSLGTLLSASLLIEVVMGWPGLAPLLVESIMARDIAVVLGAIMLSAAFLIAGNLVADLLLYRFDPRIRVR